MAKRKKKNQNRNRGRRHQQPRSSTLAVSSPVIDGTAEDNRPSRNVRRLIGLLAGGREAEALDHVNHLFPNDNEKNLANRIRFLLHHWPQRAVHELLELPDNLVDSREVGLAVADGVLLLSDDLMVKLASRSIRLTQEAKTVHHANALVSKGDDEGAKELLTQISLRSVFYRVRIFLTGLMAFYTGQDQKANELFCKLRDSQGYSGFVRALLPIAALGESGMHASLCEDATAAVDELHRRFGSERELDIIAVGRIQNQISNQRYLKALHLFDRQQSQSVSFKNLDRDLICTFIIRNADIDKLLTRIIKVCRGHSDDLAGYRIPAMVAEWDGAFEEAIVFWSKYRASIKQKKCRSFQAEERQQAQTAILHRCARLEMMECKQSASSSFPFDLDFLDQSFFDTEDLDELPNLFEQVIQEDPTHLPYWHDLFEALQLAGKPKERDRAIDRCVKQFPGHPKVLVEASKAALARQAFDKALSYTNRALEAEPLNRSLNDLKAESLTAKAAKKYKTHGEEEARKWLEAALAVPYQTSVSLLRTASIGFLFESGLGNSSRALEIKSDALSQSPNQWIFCLFLAQNESFWNLGRVKKRKVIQPDPNCFFVPKVQPESDELESLLHLAKKVQESQALPAGLFNSLIAMANPAYGLSSKLANLLDEAISQGVHALDSQPMLIAARGFCTTIETRFKVLERLYALWPNDPKHVCERLELAMDLGKPPEYFASASEEIKQVFDALPEEEENDQDIFGLAPSLRVMVGRTRKRLKGYLKQGKAKSQKPQKQKNKKKAKHHQRSLPF